MGQDLVHPYIQSTTVLCDTLIHYNLGMRYVKTRCKLTRIDPPVIELNWEKVEDQPITYRITAAGGIQPVNKTCNETSCILERLQFGTDYTFTVDIGFESVEEEEEAENRAVLYTTPTKDQSKNTCITGVVA